MGQRILLINMPWSRVHSPCLGLSLLKPLVERESVAVDILYFNLLWAEILYRYHAAWLGRQELERSDLTWDDETVLFQDADSYYFTEWVFSQHYYGPGSLGADEFIRTRLSQRYSADQIRYWLGIRDLVPEFMAECLRRIKLDDYSLVGFTSQFRQNLSSLSLARLIKQAQPEIRIIFGGSNCAGVMGETLLRYFPFVDYVADGEAEISFPALVRELRQGETSGRIPGILARSDGEIVNSGPPHLVTNLDELPWPDFGDFFDQFRKTGLGRLLSPSIMLELSRGCWWGMRHQCKFCGNRARFIGYRPKSAQRALGEILQNVTRYGVSRVNFADTILGQQFFNTLLPDLATSGLELKFFFEVKSNLKKEQIRMMSRAGVSSVQPGIESFSTRLLGLMNKGVNALQNVQCLKWCAQFNIIPYWNLLYGFPYETPEDYAIILEYIRRISHLRHPLTMGPIRLDRFSPHFHRAAEYGFINVRPMLIYPFIYDMPPGDLQNIAYGFTHDYADGRDVQAYVGQARAFVERWTKEPKGELIHFDLQDGSGLIVDSRFNRVLDRMELEPFDNSVYKWCGETAHFNSLVTRLQDGGFGADGKERLTKTLRRFVDSLWMVSERDRYLSVALEVRTGSQPGEAVTKKGDWLALIA